MCAKPVFESLMLSIMRDHAVNYRKVPAWLESQQRAIWCLWQACAQTQVKLT